MCGIFGVIAGPNSGLNEKKVKQCFEIIAKLSLSRGSDSAGVSVCNLQKKVFEIVKGDIPIHDLLKSKEYKKRITEALISYQKGNVFNAMGHARLVTNGSQLAPENNQPVVKDKIIAVHNGIIVNDGALWKKFPYLKREFNIDTEILLSLIRSEFQSKKSVKDALCAAYKLIEGTASVAMQFQDLNQILLFTNNGSLFYFMSDGLLIFASEKYFLDVLVKKQNIAGGSIQQVSPGFALLYGTKDFEITEFKIQDQTNSTNNSILNTEFDVEIISLKGKERREVVIDPLVYINRNKEKNLYDLLENNEQTIEKLKRCSKCILPETFPFIHFNELGVCNYCLNYKKKVVTNSLDNLKNLVAPYRRNDGRPDCIVPFSGGRDSTYALHIIKNELKLNPIAFTYDWGMVTDLARRNIARACGKLGVENIIVAADIHKKRENIRLNILAWMKKPSLGMIPLFMAGDKYFFYYCEQVKKQTGIDLNIWGINNLENTDFKTGFAGLKPNFNKERIYSLTFQNQLNLFKFVFNNIILNPAYINQSLFDTFGSFAVRYFSPRKDYFHLFDYYNWNEDELNQLIKNEYGWETAIDTNSTWRIGDGTASFYNYVYYTVAGFSENDTFRSNQIREGLITRNNAINRVRDENKVRYETLRWYFEILGLNFADVMQVVSKIPKLYR